MALTEIPVELSSTPGIADSSNATAITIDSSENTNLSGSLVIHGDADTATNAQSGSVGIMLYASGDTAYVTSTSNGNSHRYLELSAINSGTRNDNQLFLSYTGDVAVGTNAPTNVFDTYFTTAGHTSGISISNGQNGGYGSCLAFNSRRSDSPNSILTAARVRTEGSESWGSDATTSSNLVFETRHDNTLAQRLNLDSMGNLRGSSHGTVPSFDRYGFESRAGSAWTMTIRSQSTGTEPHGLLISYAAAAPDNGSSYFIYGADTSAARFFFGSNGNLWTSDHGWISSDERLKENIVDATSKLDDVMKLKVRNFNWKADYHPNENGKKIGFIAQEFEEVFPGLIEEHDIAPKSSADEDADHTPNIKKSITQGALIPILVKAMQEQQALIETLQTKVAALEEA